MRSLTYAVPPRNGGFTIKKWPSGDRPRERLHRLGQEALSARELLALIIETGSPAQNGRPARSAMDLAGDLLKWFAPPEGGESLRRIMTAPLMELCKVPGIGPAKAAKVLAALDLGRRAAEEARPERDRVETPRDVYERMRTAMRDMSQEEFHILLLNAQNEVLREVVVGRGTLTRLEVHARDVFRPALAESAHCVVLVHNHPSGDPAPSAHDRELTRGLMQAGRVLGIPVHDHVILGERRYFSFAEEGVLAAL